MEALNFTGKIIAATSVRSGNGAKGHWTAQDYVAENTEGRFPSRMVFTVYGEDKIKEFGIKIGDEVTVSFEPSATERDGRWFGSNKAYRVVRK